MQIYAVFRSEEIKRKGEEADSTKKRIANADAFNFTTDTYIVHMYLLKMIDIRTHTLNTQTYTRIHLRKSFHRAEYCVLNIFLRRYLLYP